MVLLKKTSLFLTFFLCFTSTLPLHLWAIPFLSIGPIVGYERVQKIKPQAHTTDRLIYGLNVQLGPQLLSIDATLTQGQDSESFPAQNFSAKEKSTTGQLGIRSSFSLFTLLRWYLRAGGQASQIERTEIQNDITTTSKPPIKVYPYAGTGFSLSLTPLFQMSGGVTVVFVGDPVGKKYEYQTVLGFTVKI